MVGGALNPCVLGIGLEAPDSSPMGGAIGVGDSEISPMAAVSGRNSDAITMRWLLNELIVADDDDDLKMGAGSETLRWRRGL